MRVLSIVCNKFRKNLIPARQPTNGARPAICTMSTSSPTPTPTPGRMGHYNISHTHTHIHTHNSSCFNGVDYRVPTQCLLFFHCRCLCFCLFVLWLCLLIAVARYLDRVGARSVRLSGCPTRRRFVLLTSFTQTKKFFSPLRCNSYAECAIVAVFCAQQQTPYCPRLERHFYMHGCGLDWLAGGYGLPGHLLPGQ